VKEMSGKSRQEEKVVFWLEIRCYCHALMQQLMDLQVCPKTLFITGQIVAVIAGVRELGSP